VTSRRVNSCLPLLLRSISFFSENVNRCVERSGVHRQRRHRFREGARAASAVPGGAEAGVAAATRRNGVGTRRGASATARSRGREQQLRERDRGGGGAAPVRAVLPVPAVRVAPHAAAGGWCRRRRRGGGEPRLRGGGRGGERGGGRARQPPRDGAAAAGAAAEDGGRDAGARARRAAPQRDRRARRASALHAQPQGTPPALPTRSSFPP
jgi:hypothetical protein